MLPVFSRLSFSPQPRQPRLLKSRQQKVLGIFVKLLNLAVSQKETALNGAEAVWEMIEIWHSCGRLFLNVRGAAGGPASEQAARRPGLRSTRASGRRMRRTAAREAAFAVGPAFSGLRCHPSKASGAGCGRCRQRPVVSEEETEAQRGAVTGPKSHSRER